MKKVRNYLGISHLLISVGWLVFAILESTPERWLLSFVFFTRGLQILTEDME